MLRNILFTSLIIIGSVLCVTGQGLSDTDIRQAEAALAGSRPDTERVKLLLRCGELYAAGVSGKHDVRDSASYYARKAYDLSVTLRYQDGIDRSLKQMLHIGIKRKDRAISRGESGAAELVPVRKYEGQLLARFKGSTDEKAALYQEIGDFYEESNENLPEKRKWYNLALQGFRASKNAARQGGMLLMLGEMSLAEGNLADAKARLMESVTQLRSVNGKELPVA